MDVDFKRAMVYCAAISSFAGGAYVGLSGVKSIQVDSVKSIVAAELAAKQPPLEVQNDVSNTNK